MPERHDGFAWAGRPGKKVHCLCVSVAKTLTTVSWEPLLIGIAATLLEMILTWLLLVLALLLIMRTTSKPRESSLSALVTLCPFQTVQSIGAGEVSGESVASNGSFGDGLCVSRPRIFQICRP